jgi:hypothetical protein
MDVPTAGLIHHLVYANAAAGAAYMSAFLVHVAF